MTRYLTYLLVALFGMVALVGCHASGSVGETTSVVTAAH
jgi:hypothetical protein